ncbi:MAG: SIMPL domain-containing protein, partial [Candidatus Magasanikbacteria bacterium]|nr:SIMPL domain-containing protein [Candidatus Magasanikbacteria bacterium]
GENFSNCGCGARSMSYCGHFTKKMVVVLFAILLLYGIVYVGTLINNNLKQYNYIGRADRMERTIIVNGYGKVSGNNDIAMTTIGYSNTDKDVAVAQANNKKVMDQISTELKKMGVADKDLQNNYTIYPNYNYTQQKGQELIGYQVSNQLTIKIRDLTKIPDILSLAGKYGATEVSGLNFTIDDPENLKADARAKALIDARVKARDLAQKLGVNIGSVVAYNEFEGGTGGPVYSMKNLDAAAGVGGGPEVVSSGSRDVEMNVSVTYEILP